eukprot:75597_1
MKYTWFMVLLIGLTIASIDKTVSVGDCDLGTVAVGGVLECPFTVQEDDSVLGGEGDTVTVRNQLQLIDSTGSTNSFCENARVSIVYFNGDYGDAHEYMNLYEGLTTDEADLVQNCAGNGIDQECVYIDCPLVGGDTALSNSYAVGSSVDLTMYVSAGVDGLHHDGVTMLCSGRENILKIDSAVTFKCTKAVVGIVMPVLFWDFEAQDPGATEIPDSISGEADYAMQLLNGAAITSEGLNCGGGAGYAHTGELPSALFGGTGAQPHSLEAKFKLFDLDQSGTSPLSLDTYFNWPGTYDFEAIVYDEFSDNKFFAGSAGHHRTVRTSHDVAETATDEYIHFVITYDSDGSVAMYRNGEYYGGGSTGSFIFYENIRALICIRHQGVSSLNGVVTGAAVYDQVLDLATVEKHYAHYASDLCTYVTCEDDGDACTVEYCDADTGECTSGDLECDDSDSCTIDTCDSTVGCVFTEMECSDGNICNGEEACIEGGCVSPMDFECPINFVCDADAASCLRDCSLFAIDGYLNDCSESFDVHSNALVELEDSLSTLSVSMTSLDEQVTANTEEIAAGALAIDELQTSAANIAADVATNTGNIETNTEGIATNTGDIETNDGLIGTNTYNIATNAAGVSANVQSIAGNAEDVATNAAAHSTNAEGIASNAEAHQTNTGAITSNVALIGGLEERVSALEERVYGFGTQSDQGEGDGSNSLNGPDETTTDEEESVGIVPDLSRYHNEVIVCLVVVNVMMVLLLCCIGICYCRGEKRTIFVDRRSNKYAPVQVYSSADDEAARLNM